MVLAPISLQRANFPEITGDIMIPVTQRKKLLRNFRKCLAVSGFSIALVGSLLFTGCANIQPPMGGKKDTIPPVLTKAAPLENTLNFKGNTLRFEFDEFIRLNNLNENLIINPPAEKYPIILSKLRNLSVKLLDTLQPNTTYTINFGDAVVDVNENNPLKNFSYAFSTGPYIDSLELSGRIVDAETGLADSTLTIILHSHGEDSTVVKEKPRFVTRPNGQGVFHFDHLPGGKFFIFGLKDEGVKRYTSNRILFAFYDSLVTTGSADSIMLRAFIGEKEPEKVIKTTSLPGKSDKDNKDDKKLKFVTSVTGNSQDLLSPLSITFTHKLKTLDSAKIHITDTLFNPVAYSMVKDTTGMGIQLRTTWKDDAFYTLVLEKGFAADSAGATTTKTDTIDFKTKAESEYGALKIKFTGLDMSRHPVLQFVENTAVSNSAPLTGSTYTIKLFRPAQYTIRILYDANQNGVWDTGDYWKKVQPEFVIPVEQQLNIKANWDNEFDINL
jgi:hypothetical protein